MSNYINEFIELLKRLIKYRSLAINKNECYGTVKELLKMLREIGFDVEIIEYPEANPVVLASLKGKSDRYLLFYNHYDVQPVEPFSEWNSDPFELTEKSGYIYGRGVGDNKGNIVSRFIAVKQVLEEEGSLPYGVKFVIEGEEEAGSPHLKEMLISKREFFSDIVGVIWEFGGFNRDGSITVTLGLKGILYIELRARRLKRDAHSALAVLLPSAAWNLIGFLADLKACNLEKISSFHDNIIDVREIISEIRNEGHEIAFDPQSLMEEFGISEFINGLTNEEALIAYYGNPTFNINGLITGYVGRGTKTVLPAEASVKIDFRLVPNQDPLKISKEFCELAKKYNIDCMVHSMTEPTFTDFKNQFVQEIIRKLSEIGERIKIAPWSPASGPMHIFTKYFNLPIVAGIGVSYWGSGHHAPNENIRLSDVERVIKILKHIIKSPFQST